jgi:outer membrane receptor protein involved in Fe transport
VNALFASLAPFGTSQESQLGVPIGFTNAKWDKWTGRAVLNYTPKLDFTDQTLIYASYARGYKAGGFNPALPPFALGETGALETYEPEGIDAFELGTKNILFGSTLQANFDVWYYNYENLQITQIIFNDSVNFNVNSRMYGSEGQLVWAPDDHWAFNLNIGYDHSAIGNSSFVDTRNPTAGAADAVLVKDGTGTASAAQNCVLYRTTAVTAPADNPVLITNLGANNPFFDPPGGAAVLASKGIALTQFGSCNAAFLNLFGLSGSAVTLTDSALLTAAGYSWTQPGGKGTALGVSQSLHGNQNPYTPPWSIGFGAQYTFNVIDDYTLVPRVDMYWQTQSWGRPFEDGADKIPDYFYANAQVQFNAPDNAWYLQAFVKNVFNKTYVTGQYLTSSSSGLYTNEFLGDPRTYGIRAGIHF